MLTKEIQPDKMMPVQSVDSAIDNYLNMAKTYINYNSEFEIGELTNFLSMNPVEDTEIIIESSKKKSIDSAGFNMYYFNYMGYIMIVCFILSVGTVMMSLNGLDISRRQSVSPVSSRGLNFQLILANLVFVVAYLSILIIIGYLANPLRSFDFGFMLMVINSFVFALVTLCISYLIGISIKEKNAIQALSTALY